MRQRPMACCRFMGLVDKNKNIESCKPYPSCMLLCFPTHQVCAVGKVLCVGAAMIWNEGQRVLKPPGGSWEDPVVN